MFRMARSLALPALFAVLVLFGCAKTKETPRAGLSTDTRAEIDSLFESYVDALNASDSTTVRAMFGPGNEVTVAGRERFLRGDEGIGRTTENLLAVGQNKFDIDSLEVIPIENAHALALVIYTVEPSDQDVPAFHTTGTYVLERSSTTAKWAIIHAHVCPAREL
ncbi:MAG TPA: hypothetical protein VFD83_01380 [Candidatus Polarisedimenticolia bacterium]|nr:hypothetical protein [Candidatus Polarisedimenticolia bacterium]